MTSAPDQRGSGWAPAPVGPEDTLPAVLPTPIWSRRPATLPVRRLTGLWAWLLAVVLGSAVVAAVTGA
jgi:hypothetical protein